MHPFIDVAHQLKNKPDVIRRFPLKSEHKIRWVNDPIPELKSAMKQWNAELTNHYVNQLEKHNLTKHAQAYLPNKSIKTNAKIHQNSDVIIKFDFSGFYDSVIFDYIRDDIRHLTNASDEDLALIERLIIDPNTGGVTQGLPVSGALAGLALIPFWKQLRKDLNPNIEFTQYSDDLTFSIINPKNKKGFTTSELTKLIKQTMINTNRLFKLNDKKTTTQQKQFRKITGVRINHNNQLSCSRKDYRMFRTVTHVLSKDANTLSVLKRFGFDSVASFSGKISYMRTIDETGKINRWINKNSNTFMKHNLFKRWIIMSNDVFT